MTDEIAGEWINCEIDNDYEIYDQFPYPIRRKGLDEPISEIIDENGYVNCYLNRKHYKKHRIIAFQFIPNPNNFPQVDHVNHNRTDNRVENLRWCSVSQNQRNRSSNGHGYQYTFLDELPESAESLDSYNGHDFDGLYVDYENQKLYLFNGIRYRELIPCRNQGNIVYYANDIENINRGLYHKVLFA